MNTDSFSFNQNSSSNINSPAPFAHFNNSPALLARGTRVVSAGTITTLLKICELKNKPELPEIIATQFGFDYKSPPLAYPYNKYLDIAESLRLTLYRDIDPEIAYDEMGYLIGQTYFLGFSGQILKKMARVMGPQRGSKQFLQSISRALPWGVHELKEIKSNYICYHKSLVGGPPPLMLGLLRSCLEASGVTLVRANYTVLSAEEDDILYEIEWK